MSTYELDVLNRWKKRNGLKSIDLCRLAGKAIGLEFNESYGKGLWVGEYYSGKEFNPMDSNNDALFVLVTLGLSLEFNEPSQYVICDGQRSFFNDDRFFTVRCAIVTAAAEIQLKKDGI